MGGGFGGGGTFAIPAIDRRAGAPLDRRCGVDDANSSGPPAEVVELEDPKDDCRDGLDGRSEELEPIPSDVHGRWT